MNSVWYDIRLFHVVPIVNENNCFLLVYYQIFEEIALTETFKLKLSSNFIL